MFWPISSREVDICLQNSLGRPIDFKLSVLCLPFAKFCRIWYAKMVAIIFKIPQIGEF